MALFEKKKEPAAPAAEDRSAVDIIKDMKSQGYNNNQIVDYLQKQGLKSDDIFDAMNKAEAGTPAGPVEGFGPVQQPPMQMGSQQMQFMPPMSDAGISKEQIEEISESIVDEKIEDIKKEFKKISDWKDSAETRLTALEQKLEDISKNFDVLSIDIDGNDTIT